MIRRKDKLWAVVWGLFHSLWLVACAVDPEWVDWYAGTFVALEAVGLAVGAPFTRYIHGLVDWGRARSTLALAATVIPVLIWCAVFSTLFRDHGWFSPGWNTALAVGFYIYILPHFFGRHW